MANLLQSLARSSCTGENKTRKGLNGELRVLRSRTGKSTCRKRFITTSNDSRPPSWEEPQIYSSLTEGSSDGGAMEGLHSVISQHRPFATLCAGDAPASCNCPG